MLAAMALGGCAARGPDQPEATFTQPEPPVLPVRAYDCQGLHVVCRLENDGKNLVVALPDRTVRLAHQPAASGAKYSNGSTTFWTKGPVGFLEQPGDPMLRCEENRMQSLREEARLRGVAFRGLGNEPGWVLEIGPDRIVFDYDYGEGHAEFPLAAPIDAPDSNKITYAAERAGQRIQIDITRRRCVDSMRGDSFPSRVRVQLDDRTFGGCGETLL